MAGGGRWLERRHCGGRGVCGESAGKLGMFPGMTWDSRADDYRKTAWLWRLFRWERDAEGRTGVDVLFVPVWRGGAKSEG